MARSSTLSILGCVGLAILAGCTHTVVVGRYANAICDSPSAKAVPCHDVIPAADVSVVTIATPTASSGPTGVSGNATSASATAEPTPLVSATNFPDHALAEYIKVLADPKFSPTAESLRQNIAAALKAGPTVTVDDRTVLHRNMIVTVTKDPLKFNPADRIEATAVFIEPLDGVTFTSWDTAVTLYTTINAGTIQLTQTQNSGQTLTAGTPSGAPITGSLGLTAGQGETRVENFNATSQVENLTVSVIDGKLRIRRQGGSGIDLTGNTIIKVDLTVPSTRAAFKPVFSISGDYQDKDQKWVLPEKLNLKADIVYVATKPENIAAKMTLIYTVRHITSGDETIEEKDDTVQELTFVNEPVISVLVPGRQVSPPSYALWGLEKDGRGPVPVYIARPTSSRNAPLCFNSYEAANDLLAYIQHGNQARPEILGPATLGFGLLSGFTPLQPQDVQQLFVTGCP